jgi:hypothetical protein
VYQKGASVSRETSIGLINACCAIALSAKYGQAYLASSTASPKSQPELSPSIICNSYNKELSILYKDIGKAQSADCINRRKWLEKAIATYNLTQ